MYRAVVFAIGILWAACGAAAPAFAGAETGGRLFRDKGCWACHDTAQPGTEFKPICPGLKGVRERHARAWLQQWLLDPQAVWAANGADVQDINARYFKFRGVAPKPRESFMATFIGKTVILTPEEVEHLIDYLMTLE